MTPTQKITMRLSQVRERLNEISGLDGDAFTDEVRSESASLQSEYADLESRHRAAIIGESVPEIRHAETGDAEQRERVELRSTARLTNYILARSQGRLPSGAEAELNAAAGVNDGGIPLELWDVAKRETRAITDAPGTVGVNLDSIRPAVFSAAILPRLGVDMPRVSSGSFASATISTSQTASALAKSGEAMATAGAFTVTPVTPKRISARLELTIEDIAAVGQDNFESILRENLSLALSAALDNQGLNGDGQAPNLAGIFSRLTAPSDPGVTTDFDYVASIHAGGVDGLWATTLKDVAVLVGPATYQVASRMFQTATNYKGELSAAAYAMANTGGFWTNSRMPDAVSTIQQAILYRMGRSFLNMGEGYSRTAVCPTWNEVSIDDIYSGSAKGERYFTMHVLLGDVILVQPDAYAQIAYKVA